MRAVLVVEIEAVDSGIMSDLVGAIRESVAKLGADSSAGISMTAHVLDAADRIAAAVKAEMGEH